MAIGSYNIAGARGTDIPLGVLVTDDAGNVLDLSSFAAALNVYQSNGGALLLSLTSSSGWCNFPLNMPGVVNVLLAGAVTSGMAALSGGFYTLTVTSPDGQTVNVLQGTCNLT